MEWEYLLEQITDRVRSFETSANQQRLPGASGSRGVRDPCTDEYDLTENPEHDGDSESCL